jgi:hypothetical protein
MAKMKRLESWEEVLDQLECFDGNNGLDLAKIENLRKPLLNQISVKFFSFERFSLNLLQVQRCKVCGVIQTLENTAENHNGSGKLRSKCKKCTNKSQYKRINPKPTKLVFKFVKKDELVRDNKPIAMTVTVNISSTRNKNQLPMFVETNNPVRQAVQTLTKRCPKCGEIVMESDVVVCPYCDIYYHGGLTICPVCSERVRYVSICPKCGIVHRPTRVEHDVTCGECGSVVRFDEKRNKICDACGLATTATDIEIGWMGYVSPGYRLVITNRETEWKMLEHDDTVYENPYQPLWWTSPEDLKEEEETVPDVDPKKVPKTDEELLEAIDDARIKNGSRAARPDCVTKSARFVRLHAMFTGRFGHYVSGEGHGRPDLRRTWGIDPSWGLWEGVVHI